MLFLVLVVWVLIGIWGLYSLLCIAFPLKPFKARSSAAKSFAGTLIAWVGVFIVLGTADFAPSPSTEAATVTTTQDTATEAATTCGDNGLALNDIVAARGQVDIRIAPDVNAARLRNEKASKALSGDHFHTLPAGSTVRRLCAQAKWTEFQVVTPEFLADITGWVPNENLEAIAKDAEGRRIFVEGDFYWDGDTSAFKPQIVAVVNKISRENVNCPDPDLQSVTKSESRSSPNAPVFFVTCGSGMDVFNVWFSPDDAKSDKTLNAVLPPSETSAVSACEQTAVNAASHPSTVKFSRVMSLTFRTWKNGNAEVRSTFTAKNAFNLETKYDIICSFTGSKMSGVSITEARN